MRQAVSYRPARAVAARRIRYPRHDRAKHAAIRAASLRERRPHSASDRVIADTAGMAVFTGSGGPSIRPAEVAALLNFLTAVHRLAGAG